MPNIFLDREMARDSIEMYVNQHKYVLDLLPDAGLTGAMPVTTPLPKNQNFTCFEGIPLAEPHKYRHVGRLLYLNLTRPDITFTSQQLSEFVQVPTEAYWAAALHVLKYLKQPLYMS